MLTIPVRELNQHTAQVLERIAESGEPAAITRNGKVGWHITPASGTVSRIDALIEAGLASNPVFDRPLPKGPVPVPSGSSVDQILAELDGDH
jgi:antitoxin (DNA-binding transcriptional repressor) of toxin-antitoxin stability system